MTYALAFVPLAWEDYQHWQQTDKAILKRLHILLKELQRTPLTGTGKPELLKHDRAGTWSRRITDEHRLVYRVEGEAVWILQCRYHYAK
ncbi:Txe/YoeB family addiction module toxin [Hymenobacter lapidiphilus]|uniref:Txe/YoeB family addiction module toxin n=1 Tax=Hymenobacter sp. CCM 8763 TaxID=2303334 RepID=UPI000E34479E|nr:Txe/YoeB family addiction module toxin [Hymenobacter sp. CCM 8763]RFP66648.1 Txe/YoeB family addiction module toxin [Hymenobacter sp. CCM 8763]